MCFLDGSTCKECVFMMGLYVKNVFFFDGSACKECVFVMSLHVKNVLALRTGAG